MRIIVGIPGDLFPCLKVYIENSALTLITPPARVILTAPPNVEVVVITLTVEGPGSQISSSVVGDRAVGRIIGTWIIWTRDAITRGGECAGAGG